MDTRSPYLDSNVIAFSKSEFELIGIETIFNVKIGINAKHPLNFKGVKLSGKHLADVIH